MAGRSNILSTGEIYHIFNRGVEHRQVFDGQRDYRRAVEVMDFYRFNPKIKFSDLKNLPLDQREKTLKEIHKLPKIVEFICYSFLPNHFHFLLQQLTDNGISNFVSKFTNSYTKYFNTKNKRDGGLFGGTFKSVRVEDEKQLLHLSRYIHINPVVSYLIQAENLENYQWSSFPEFMRTSDSNSPTFCKKELILSQFKSPVEYKNFVLDQVDYARVLENIKHQILE